ncbi:glycine cleavage system protein H [Aldersonia kunmingensis]|uniref:glycine cleavage system protein H n=1 Tax=Aldersonia kunmingensis TaxID=408066 RepID=UPI0008318A6B|nr:hypothetical protein [Aldersonia kunmingensis]
MTTPEIPYGLLYTDSHSWLAPAVGSPGETPQRTGVTPEALADLEIVAIDLPPVRSYVEAGMPCAALWTSAWTPVTILAPIGGLVTMTNSAAVTIPRLVVDDPFGAGWLFAVLPSIESTEEALLTADQYQLARGKAA